MVERADGLPVMKRNILKVIAGMYDPLGLLSPVLVGMKVLFQEFCVSKVDWDERITSEREKSWIGWLRDFKESHGIGQGKFNCSLYGFAGASKKPYCAVIYLVCGVSGAISSTLLTSKTRVSPIKEQTIPWLELVSGKILATPMDTVKNALNKEVDICTTRLWLGSKTALWWIENNGEWKMCVTGLTAESQDHEERRMGALSRGRKPG